MRLRRHHIGTAFLRHMHRDRQQRPGVALRAGKADHIARPDGALDRLVRSTVTDQAGFGTGRHRHDGVPNQAVVVMFDADPRCGDGVGEPAPQACRRGGAQARAIHLGHQRRRRGLLRRAQRLLHQHQQPGRQHQEHGAQHGHPDPPCTLGARRSTGGHREARSAIASAMAKAGVGSTQPLYPGK